MALAPHGQRCAAFAMRARGCLSAAQCALIRTSQDRRRVVLRLWQRPRRLRTSRARARHEHVRLVCVSPDAAASEERGLTARTIQ